MPNEIKLQFGSNYKSKDNAEKCPETPTRRTARTRCKPKKYGEILNSYPTKHRPTREIESSDDDDEHEEEYCSLKPTALFSVDDVKGQDIFKFKSRHTKVDLHNKALTAVVNSPKAMENLSTSFNSPFSKFTEATPRHVKDIMKKRIIKEVDSDSAESDFSGSSSDFVPEDNGDESESRPSSSTDSSEDDEEHGKEQSQKSKTQIVKKRENKSKNKESEYIVTPDNYFMMNSSKKIATSDHTLARLKNMNLDGNEATNIELSKEHRNKISNLNESYEHLFNRWLYVLSEDFNIVLYGVGSKRTIVHRFQQEKLSKFPCVVVNGFFPSLTIKSILESIIVDLLENTYVPSNICDVVSLIDSQLQEYDTHLFLIVHNIDGPMLRNGKAQATLSSLSQIKNVHTIATIDHINAPLLWDHTKLSKFRFTWWDVTTFLPYTEETSYENSLMTHRSGALQLSSLRSVYQSLTTNAKGIFNIIIEHQLENHKQTHYQGLPFKELYSKSREKFLVSSDLALRAQLTEFLDHKLVKMKRTYDGSENLIIPIENSLLQQFLEQQTS